ncbi:MAG: hypothetical protein KC547_22660, partial [Anaerolineae bacterium]|nr:hypothetical protein [Anaerolineae bacterium]
VRDANNETILVTEGRVPMWSDDGLLAFCRDTSLLVWDGQNMTTVASADFAVEAYWLNGSRAVCSNG